jgi:hypothetical protein
MLLDTLTRREVVIGLAIGGAIVSTIGSLARRRNARTRTGLAGALVYTGYAITSVSIFLFIAAGLRS